MVELMLEELLFIVIPPLFCRLLLTSEYMTLPLQVCYQDCGKHSNHKMVSINSSTKA